MRSPRHATVVAYAALVVALSGSAYAAATVGSAQIVDNSIRSTDVRNGGLGAVDLSVPARASLSGIPARTRLVNATGSPATNGNRLRTVLAGLGGATANAPWTVRLSPGRYALDTATETLRVPDFVTLAGDGPLTVLETGTSSTVAVLDLTGSNVVRSLTVRNPSANTGAAGIDGTGAVGSLVTDVTVEGRLGVALQASRLRDAVVTTRAEGVRIVDDAVASELDDVRISTAAGGFSGVGITAAGPADIDGADVSAFGTSSATGLLVTADGGDIRVRNSSLRASGILSAAYGAYLNPPSTSNARLYVDSSFVSGTSSGTNNAVRTDDSGVGARIGNSLLGGSPEVVEVNAIDVRCVGNFDSIYQGAVAC